MKLKYGLDDVPPRLYLLLFGLQWLAISIPGVVIPGKIVGTLHFSDAAGQIVYLQKLYFITGIALFCQVLWGHRLPLIIGPSTVLLIGVIASAASSLNAIYGSLAVGAILLTLVAMGGFFGHIRRFFTRRVVATLLLLIALTLAPTLIRLLVTTGPGVSLPANLCFASAVVLLMFLLYRRLTGIWRSTIVVWSMAGASIVHSFLFPHALASAHTCPPPLVSHFFHHLTTGFSLDPGLLISFIFCFFALSVNDISSIQSMSGLLNPTEPRKRLNHGLVVTGAANILSGVLGTLGPVNFSLSPGVIMASGCASRFTLLPAAAGLIILSFSPLVVAVIGGIPPVVIGAMFIYVLCYQIAAGLMVAAAPGEEFTVESGLVIGLPLLLGTVFSFMPADAIHLFPAALRPLAGNGFVVGVAASLVMEHLILPAGSGRQ